MGNATRAMGSKFKVERPTTANGDGTYVKVNGVRNLNFDWEWGVGDTTELDSEDDYETSDTTSRRINPVTFDVFHKASDGTQDELTGYLKDWVDDAERWVRVVPREGKSRRFKGKFVKVSEPRQAKEHVIQSVVFQPSGKLYFEDDV